MYNNLEELNNLSEKEKEIALKILNEYSSNGFSNTYNKLLLDDYKEMPVDIITFIKDYRYLGKAWHTSTGKCKLYPYWEEKLKLLFPDPYTTNYNNFIESGARGIGKAQPLTSLVFTNSGYKRMGDITLGTQVYGIDGNLHKVIGVFPQGIKKCYKVNFSDSTSTICAEDHLWTVFDRKQRDACRVLSTKQLLEEALYRSTSKESWVEKRFSIPIVKPLNFEYKETFISPYLMGCLLGDGYFGKHAVSLCTADNEILEYFSNELSSNNYSYSVSTFKNASEYTARSYTIKNNNYKIGARTPNKYLEYIKELGLCGRHSYDKFIPDIYKYNDTQSRIELLQGLMDTDGEINKNYQEYFTTTSSQLAEDIKFIVQSLGGTVILKHHTDRQYNYRNKNGEKELRCCRDIYTLNIKLPSNIQPCKLQRKLNNLKLNRKEPGRRIVSIEPVESQECQCIVIDSDDHLYLTNDLIATHNSEIAVTIGLYLMHRLMCLKNPHDFYDLKPTEKFAFAFMNITITLAEDIGISKFQETVQLSPWFMDRGYISGRDIKIWNPPDFINIIIGSQSSHLIGQAIMFAFFDEISFIKNMDIEKQKKIATDMMDTAIGGMKTRFIHNGKNPTILVLASSKRTEKSFLEEHMRKKLKEEDESVIIIDEPVWNIKPKDTYSGKTFYVAQGNRFLVSEIIPDNDTDLKSWKDKGYNILKVPIEFKSDFRDDIDRALCDFAGISSSELMKYISGPRWLACRDLTYQNPFIKEIIEVGNAVDDTTQYYDFFDLSKVDRKYIDRPLFIHLDMSLSGDKTGIAGVWILGKKRSSENENSSEELYFKLAFHVSIKAPKGYQVSFAKNREFIYWLKNTAGFAIKGITSDTFQNAALGQDFLSKGYPYSVLSVDRVDNTRICPPYAYFKNAIYEQRILIYDNENLTSEVLQLERNESSGKVDHPDGGCFTGETKVALTDGRQLSFYELVDEYNSGKTNYVYSIDTYNKNIAPGKIIKAWKTLENQPIIKITLDNDETIECTYNHKFMLRNGSYIEAKDLIIGDSLMPLYTKISEKGLNGYRLYYNPFDDKWHYEHRSFASEILDEKSIVHHKNCNKLDNSPDNLIYCSRSTHQKIHAEIESGAQSVQAKRKRSESLHVWHQSNKNTEAYKQRSEKCKESVLKHNLQKYGHNRIVENKQRIKAIENQFNVNWDELTKSERNSYGNKYTKLLNPEIQENITERVRENHKLGKYKNAKQALQKYNDETKYLKSLFPIIDKDEFENIFGFSYDNLPSTQKPVWSNRYRRKLYELKNHTVKNIEFLNKLADVYDIEVDIYHNFALASGVFVHNSKDASDAVCGALYNASLHGDEFAFYYGEDIENTITVSGQNSELTMKQVQIDMQEELNKLFNPLDKEMSSSNLENQSLLDFGFGKATHNFNMAYLTQGIIV